MLPEKKECTACGNCILACHYGAISLVKDDYDNLYPSVDEAKCHKCGMCAKVCPQISINHKNKPQMAYVGWSKDNIYRKIGASGGVASTLARHFLENNGASNGVVINEEYEAHHIMLNSIVAKKSSNSKYTFSYMDEIVKEIADNLKSNKKCIFIGLPCQCAALIKWCYTYEIDTDLLYVVDLACHGIPAGEYFKDHIKELMKENNIKIKEVCFRNHEVGSKKAYVFTLKNENGQICYKKAVWNDDNYQIAYHSALMYRENCYHCKYASENRVGDLSLADAYWMKNESKNQKDYFRGATCVLANTQKGIDLLSNMQANNEVDLNEIELDKVLKSVKQFQRPSSPSVLHDEFFGEYAKRKNFDEVCKRVLRGERLKRKLFYWIKPTVAAILRNEHALGKFD